MEDPSYQNGWAVVTEEAKVNILYVYAAIYTTINYYNLLYTTIYSINYGILMYLAGNFVKLEQL